MNFALQCLRRFSVDAALVYVDADWRANWAHLCVGKRCMLRLEQHTLLANSACVCRLQVNLRSLLSTSNLTARQLFECLCERDRARLWPWLREAQTEALQRYLQSGPPVLDVRHLFDSVLARVIILRRCAARTWTCCQTMSMRSVQLLCWHGPYDQLCLCWAAVDRARLCM